MSDFDFLDLNNRAERFKEFVSDAGIRDQIEESRGKSTFTHQLGRIGPLVLNLIYTPNDPDDAYDEEVFCVEVLSDPVYEFWICDRELDLNNLNSLEDQIIRIVNALIGRMRKRH